MPKLTPGTGTTAMVDIGEDTEVTTDHMDIMVTTERDLLMRLPLPLVPTPMLQLTPGTDITALVDTEATMVVTMADLTAMVTTERDLLMKLPLLNLAPTLMPKLTPGMGTTAMVTGLTGMVTTALATGAITGDKKWTSRTTFDLSLPTHL